MATPKVSACTMHTKRVLPYQYGPNSNTRSSPANTKYNHSTYGSTSNSTLVRGCNETNLRDATTTTHLV